MKITPVKHDYVEMMAKSVNTDTRTPGLHMSDLYNALYQDLEPKRYKKDSKPDDVKMGLGLTLEQILEDGLKQRLVERPDEQSVQVPGLSIPIYYSPDLIIFNGHTKVGEIKLTWMSSSEVPRTKGIDNFPSKFDKYFCQMKMYCRALEVNHAQLIVCFINGRWDWKDKENGFRPELLVWDIEFSKRELEEEWQTVMNYGKSSGLFKRFEQQMNRRKL